MREQMVNRLRPVNRHKTMFRYIFLALAFALLAAILGIDLDISVCWFGRCSRDRHTENQLKRQKDRCCVDL